jgi:hypothetical protein
MIMTAVLKKQLLRSKLMQVKERKDIKSIASINQSHDLNEYKYKSYEELSQEFQKVYPAATRTFVLIPQMYNRLIDGLTHKEALAKIHNDHNHLPGFTERNIRRYLPANNPNIPKGLGRHVLKTVLLKPLTGLFLVILNIMMMQILITNLKDKA